MKEIIKKAIEGGYVVKQYSDNESLNNDFTVLDPLFWQSLSKACGWSEEKIADGEGFSYEWIINALEFHEINLTEGFDKAVEYLKSVIINK